jgi:hypothetical protein
MRIGAHFGPFYASQRVGFPRRRYYRRGSGNWLGWLVILAGLGWLISLCDPQQHGSQPTQITPPLAPITTTTPTTSRPLTGTEQYCLAHPDDYGDCGGTPVTTTPTWTPPTTLPPWTPITTLPPQISVPSVPMVPPSGEDG